MNAPSIQLTFNFEATPTGMDKAVSLLKYADKLNIPPSEISSPPATPAPAKGKTPPPAPAKGKAAAAPPKGNSKAKPKEPDLMDLNLGDEEDEEETGGLGLADDEPEPEEELDGTPEDAKEEALAILRTMLGNGLKDDVKKIQKIMNVAKFHDVPAEQGHEFLAAVKKVEAQIAKRN